MRTREGAREKEREGVRGSGGREQDRKRGREMSPVEDEMTGEEWMKGWRSGSEMSV